MIAGPSQVRRGEITSLTGLRGLAALCVVITHYWYWTTVTPVAVLPPAVAQWTGTSRIGMAIFFTLSGYVIALSYSHWHWREAPLFNLTRLFFYRFARLYPAFFAFAMLIFLRHPEQHDLSNPATRDFLLPHFLLLHSWVPFKYNGALAAEGPFHVSWSLSVECALYLLFGLGAIFAAVLPRWRRKRLFLAAAFFLSVGVSLHLATTLRDHLIPEGWTGLEWDKWLLQLSPWAISLQFGLGVLTYSLYRRPLSERSARFASNLGAAGLVAVYFLIGRNVLHDAFQESILTAMATALLMIGAQSESIMNRFLSSRAMVYIGTISYSLYLFHFLTPGMANARSFDVYNETAMAYHAVNFLTSLFITIVFSTGMYRIVEVPARRAIRAAADRLLGIQRTASMSEQGAPAE
jgi:peptidoglycan/LPS O-acetylase OafA/YrhL